MDLTGNTVLITGGGTGIGRGLAEAFHKQGNQVLIAGRRQAVLDEVVHANPGVRAFRLDVESPSDIQRFASEVVAEFPTLNVLVNNAGVMDAEHLKEGTEILPIAERAVAINLLGPIRLTAALLPTLLAQPRSTVMTLAGGVAFVPMAATPTYSATKAAIHSWTQSLRFQMRDTKVEVLDISPPYVQSELFTPAGAHDERAMKLDDFISQVMAILGDPPKSGEVLVEHVHPLRNAERDGTYEKLFTAVNSMQW